MMRVVAGLAVAMAVGFGGQAARAQAMTGSGFESGEGLTPFRSERELRAFLRDRSAGRAPPKLQIVAPAFPAPQITLPSPSPGQTANVEYLASTPMEEGAAEIVVSASGSNPSITNNQTVGVDEGGIVKVAGDYLVILRRGRLFTISTANGEMRAVDAVNAYPPGVNVEDAWYDEMLVAGDRVVVIGYSYERGGTEVNRFRLHPDGRLAFEDAYHLKSNDYYSSRNYASRLIGDELILYSPLYLDWIEDPLEALPGVRKWEGDAEGAFRRVAGPRDIYVAPSLRRSDEPVEALHSVTRCDLTAAVMSCRATGVLGPESRTFYVSAEAIYLWTMQDPWEREADDRRAASSLYRIPLDGGRPQAVQTRGGPIDQFSFREDRRDGVLNVVVQSEGGGDAMWRPEFGEGAVALLRLPLRSFGDGSREAPRGAYRVLPSLPDEGWDRHNRFVGDHLLYSGDLFTLEDGATGRLVVAPLDGGQTRTFEMDRPVSRIEQLGVDALVVTSDEDVVFTTIELDRGPPRIADRYVLPEAEEGESRSHGFFYNPDPGSPRGERGVMGLPIVREAPARDDDLFWSATDMTFLRRGDGRLTPLGELEAQPERAVDDGCVASCVDWYGNARPIFLRGRTFALLGYELVEGRETDGAMREVGRVNFAPPPVVEDDAED